MNLFLYWACKIFSISAFVKLAAIFMIIEIISNIGLTFTGSWSSAVFAVIKIIVLVVFFKTGFPINAVLITYLVIYGIGCIAVFADPIGGAINIVVEILNIIGMVLFHANFL